MDSYNLDEVIGNASVENIDDGVRIHCKFNDTESAKETKKWVEDTL